MLLDGADCQEILYAFSQEIIASDKFDNSAKGDILAMVAFANYRIEMGSNERIQFNSIVASIAANVFRKTAKDHGTTMPTQEDVKAMASSGPVRPPSIESLDDIPLTPTKAKLPVRKE